MINTFDNTNCTVLDWTKLSLKPSPNGIVPEIRGFNALVTVGSEPMLLDREIVGIRPTNGTFLLDVYEPNTTDENGTISMSLFPIGTVTLALDTIKECATTEMLIADYVGDRRNYNRRLKSNEAGITDWLND